MPPHARLGYEVCFFDRVLQARAEAVRLHRIWISVRFKVAFKVDGAPSKPENEDRLAIVTSEFS